MAINRRNGKNGPSYQVKVKGSDGSWVTETFERKGDAQKREAELRIQKTSGSVVSNLNRDLILDDYFSAWDQETRNTSASAGWRSSQIQMYRDHISPVIGMMRLRQITPANISRVLSAASEKKLSASMKKHVYVLMRKLFGDAVEMFQVLPTNPVIKKLQPNLPKKEASYLEPEDAKKLLQAVRGKSYEVAVWLGVMVGRRIGEIQSLKWESVDLQRGLIQIRSTYVRREKIFRDYPKGKRWQTIEMPPELLAVMKSEKLVSKSEFVVVSESGEFLSYHTYYKALKRYCREAGVKSLSSHGLRHSCSEIYMANGASRDDMRILLNHSTSAVTDGYIHDKGERVGRVAKVIQMFPDGSPENGVSQMFPKSENG
ncbi:site-specific integrase [Bdellovibrionota bacterium FG-1]